MLRLCRWSCLEPAPKLSDPPRSPHHHRALLELSRDMEGSYGLDTPAREQGGLQLVSLALDIGSERSRQRARAWPEPWDEQWLGQVGVAGIHSQH